MSWPSHAHTAADREHAGREGGALTELLREVLAKHRADGWVCTCGWPLTDSVGSVADHLADQITPLMRCADAACQMRPGHEGMHGDGGGVVWEHRILSAAQPVPVDRESLGRKVREVWVEWAKEQPDAKPSWLVEWDDLPERDREVDRRIGEALAAQPVPCADLFPAESLALTVAAAQVRRGEAPDPNVATMCALALARLTGRYDWTVDGEPTEDGAS